MKQLILSLLLLISTAAASFSQTEKKMEKNLKVFITDKFDKKASITVQVNHDEGDMKGALKNALSMNGFKVLSETSNSKKTELEENKVKGTDTTEKKTSLSTTTYVKSHYIITLTYNGKVAPGQKYYLQCSNLRGQIVDMNNDSEIIATFSYTGNFDPDPVADAIAEKLKNH